MPQGTMSQSGTNNDFFSSIFGALQTGVQNAVTGTTALLPVWASQQLGLQQNDQLAQPTFTGTAPTTPNTALTTQTSQSSVPQSQIQRFLPLILIGGGLIVGFALLKK